MEETESMNPMDQSNDTIQKIRLVHTFPFPLNILKRKGRVWRERNLTPFPIYPMIKVTTQLQS
ncbi:unnamed protein product [Commensalibacter communis]|uniref:Uncharacterized protein n=1 Tax=Commensalibacter communis TaxID=2972786 RepID=A0A9W4TQA6_9PROT|nr:unnamed protein product [Commensalibacter communis]CAI3956321.1 unnamed protein product [Commensalibacter communis]CAI3956720.1 unnamed protein product [Commensalibacter communis]CAI3956945.1 unnamed protein product [Commensalibacter communis]